MQYKIESLGEGPYANEIYRENDKIFRLSNKLLLRTPLIDSNSQISFTEKVECFELAGPKKKIFFRPAQTKAAIATCGGLCPGINAVIRALVLQLWYRYKVKNIIGVKYGYQGFAGEKIDHIELSPDLVTNVHEQGGSILGSSRGTPPSEQIVELLTKAKVDMLFVIGGDGTMRGARKLCEISKNKGKKLSVIGIPKTIDNDIPFVKRSFGFESAVAVACQAINAAHEEARGARNGIGLVKLMGRDSGFIAANVSLASGHANFCLIPEVEFKLDGEKGLLNQLAKRLEDKGHAVIVVAEGAGQNFFMEEKIKRDASGNKKLRDIGIFLKEKLGKHFENKLDNFSLKYIDPSYLIRSTPANPADRLFCAQLAQNAVHAGMAGKTDLCLGYWHGMFTLIPLSLLGEGRQTIDPKGELWFNVLETTGQ